MPKVRNAKKSKAVVKEYKILKNPLSPIHTSYQSPTQVVSNQTTDQLLTPNPPSLENSNIISAYSTQNDYEAYCLNYQAYQQAYQEAYLMGGQTSPMAAGDPNLEYCSPFYWMNPPVMYPQIPEVKLEPTNNILMDPTRVKTTLCKYGSTCERTSHDCFFAHSPYELRVHFASDTFKKKRCNRFPNCTYKETCMFLHDETELPINSRCIWCTVLCDKNGNLIGKLYRNKRETYSCDCFKYFEYDYEITTKKKQLENSEDKEMNTKSACDIIFPPSDDIDYFPMLPGYESTVTVTDTSTNIQNNQDEQVSSDLKITIQSNDGTTQVFNDKSHPLVEDVFTL